MFGRVVKAYPLRGYCTMYSVGSNPTTSTFLFKIRYIRIKIYYNNKNDRWRIVNNRCVYCISGINF